MRFLPPQGRLVQRLWLFEAAGIVLALVIGALVREPIWLGVACAVLLAGGYAFLRHALKPLGRIGARMNAICAQTAEDEALLHAQESLDANIRLLRERLCAHGSARREGSDLYFGEHRINDNFIDVDWVKAQAGGTATIFCGDLRVATNVLREDGSRAIGTRLAAGPVQDCVFKEAKTYRGEAEILGATYLTIYEPIFCGEEVVGILYVGVPKPGAETADSSAIRLDELSEMAATVDKLEAAARAKSQAERKAAEQRHAGDDLRRRHEAATHLAAAAQDEVVARLSIALEHLAQGDLAEAIAQRFPESYEKLRRDFNGAAARLREAMAGIKTNARSMSRGCEEIAQAASDLSRRTEHQASALEQASAALSEMTQKVNESAEGARRAETIAATARTKVERCGNLMQETVAAISAIDKSAKEIAQIIGVINDIASQTNLLALNASVEAARAGDGGKGFAVVAAEVRDLAHRSADAAKQIKGLIATSATHVDCGVDRVGETGAALADIVAQVVEINTLIGSIASTARTQAVGLQEVNTAVGAMDKVTQQNAAMVEETTAASQKLAEEAGVLTNLVDHFNLGAQAADADAETSSVAGATRLRVAAPSDPVQATHARRAHG